jgi:hypothetical protein
MTQDVTTLHALLVAVYVLAGVVVAVAALLVAVLWQQHLLRYEVRASTPVQLAHAVRSVQQQLEVWAALLGEGGAREIRARLDEPQDALADHERRIGQLEGRSVGR